jgi:glycosyltransferase involved in cell wall biosynthesis
MRQTEVPGETVASQPVLSVVVPTYNRAALLDRCLAHLSAQTIGLDRFEVIVADDASEDDTGEIVARWSASPMAVHYVACPKGFAGAARNRGTEIAKADRVVFLGDDIMAAPDLLQWHLRGDERFGRKSVLVGQVDLEPNPRSPFMQFLLDEGVHHDFDFLRSQRDDPVPPWYFYACNASAPTVALRQVGGFDESLQRLREDSELGYRLVAAGYPMHFLPEARGRHIHPTNFRTYLAGRRAGRPDSVRFIRMMKAAGQSVDEPSQRPVADRLLTDGRVDRMARWTDRSGSLLPAPTRRKLYRGLLRYEERCALLEALAR